MFNLIAAWNTIFSQYCRGNYGYMPHRPAIKCNLNILIAHLVLFPWQFTGGTSWKFSQDYHFSFAAVDVLLYSTYKYGLNPTLVGMFRVWSHTVIITFSEKIFNCVARMVLLYFCSRRRCICVWLLIILEITPRDPFNFLTCCRELQQRPCLSI